MNRGYGTPEDGRFRKQTRQQGRDPQRSWRAARLDRSEAAAWHATPYSPVKPQRWVVASFEHHCGPHGLPHPHVHNIVVTGLTTGVRAV
jgi:hypothetical protein